MPGLFCYLCTRFKPYISNNGDAISYVNLAGQPRVYYRASRTWRIPTPQAQDFSPLRNCVVDSLSFDGRYASVACDHIYPGSGDDWITQGFCYDLFTHVHGMFSRSATGAVGNNAAQSVHLADDGRGLVMTSTASNLVPNDTNGRSDAFLAICR